MKHLEIKIIAFFSFALLLCVAAGLNILYALIFGFILFFGYGLGRGHGFAGTLKMAAQGIAGVKNILITFALIGLITGLWRQCGTIAFIVYHATAFCAPFLMPLLTFLLCCLISVLTGTAFGTAATMGLICVTMANGMGVSPVLSGGAVLAGAYFGDRCSPMSTSAHLICALTATDIYRNIVNMIKTAWLPFAASCLIYLAAGFLSPAGGEENAVRQIFAENFSLHPVSILPAAVIVVFSLLKVNVKLTMGVSILAACGVSLFCEGGNAAGIAATAILGYKPENAALAAVMGGGGLVSMLRVLAIVCISSCYSGIFEGTGFLDGIREHISRMAKKITPYGGVLLTSAVSAMVSCNQTLAIMLSHQLCRETESDGERMAVYLENSAVIVAPLVPWSVAAAVSLSSAGAPISGIFAACFLYLTPLWNLFSAFAERRKAAKKLAE